MGLSNQCDWYIIDEQCSPQAEIVLTVRCRKMVTQATHVATLRPMAERTWNVSFVHNNWQWSGYHIHAHYIMDLMCLCYILVKVFQWSRTSMKSLCYVMFNELTERMALQSFCMLFLGVAWAYCLPKLDSYCESRCLKSYWTIQKRS